MKDVTLRVWSLLIIDRNDGSNYYYVRKSEQQCRDRLYEWANENWDDDDIDFDSLDKDEAISDYFSNSEQDYTIDTHHLVYTTNELHDLIGEAVAGR